MANQNPQMTFGGPNPPLTLYLTNESRSRKRGARGSGARKRAIVLDGGTRIPTVGRPRAVGVHTIIRSLQRVLDGVREGNLKVYQDPGQQKEVSIAELLFLADRNTVNHVTSIGRGRAASIPDPELARVSGVDNQVLVTRRAQQEAELEARRKVAEDLEEKAELARKEVDRQEAWMEFRALMDVEHPDLDAIKQLLKEAQELAPPWLPNAWLEVGKFEPVEKDIDSTAPITEEPEPDPEPDPEPEPATEDEEPPLGDSDTGEPDLPEPEVPYPTEPEASSEDDTEEFSLEDLKSMKRAELEQLAEKHGIDNPGDRSLYPNKDVLAESLMSHVAGEAEEDENNG